MLRKVDIKRNNPKNTLYIFNNTNEIAQTN